MRIRGKIDVSEIFCNYMRLGSIFQARRSRPSGAVGAPIRSRFWGWFFIALTPAVLLFGYFLAVPPAGTGGRPTQTTIHTIVFIFWPLATMLLLRGIRLLLKDPISIVENDSRPPVLYLRGFSDDGTERSYQGLSTKESALVKYLSKLGPVLALALGRPGERLPELGAHRIYVTHENWQKVAGRLMELSQLIVMRGADSPGFEWELKNVRDNIAPEKVILWIPLKAQKRVYRKLCSLVQKCWNVTLPTRLNNRVFVAFNSQWEPRTIQSLLGADDSFHQRYSATDLSTWQHILLNKAHSEVAYLLKAMRQLAPPGYDPEALLRLLRAINFEAPPPFRLNLPSYVLLAVTWICVFLRPSQSIEFAMKLHEYFGHKSPLVAAGLECFALGAFAVILSFGAYIRSPTNKTLVTLLFCIVPLADLTTMHGRVSLKGRTPLKTQRQIDQEKAAAEAAAVRFLVKGIPPQLLFNLRRDDLKKSWPNSLLDENPKQTPADLSSRAGRPTAPDAGDRLDQDERPNLPSGPRPPN